MKVEYDSNNSGGNWWLKDQDWKNLEAAGWKVKWYEGNSDYTGGRFLGALATSATIEADSIEDAIEKWEEVTGMNASAAGCSCCGRPHYFGKAWEDED